MPSRHANGTTLLNVDCLIDVSTFSTVTNSSSNTLVAPCVPLQHSTVAGQNVLGEGGGATWPSETYGGLGGKPLKIIEIFIFEIAANASNFKN